MSFWSFLRRLWFWRRRPAREGAPIETAAEVTPESQSASLPLTEVPPHEPQPTPIALGAVTLEPARRLIEPPSEESFDEEEDEDVWDEEEEEELDEPDPFISASPSEPEPPEEEAAIEAKRGLARIEALSGEHRIYLSTPAGPGSLAEALNALAGEGRVRAEFVEDEDGEPHILYRPIH